ncbi:MAG: ArnT family glycosyltransferase [Gammaproteobacteria bacterium]
MFYVKNKSWFYDIAILTIVIGIFYALFLGSYNLLIPDEGRYAEVVREMLVTHEYLTPKINGVAFLDKPILFYWLQVASVKIFGFNTWALRFWPALLGVFGCIYAYITTRYLFGRRAGLLSAIILSTSPLYFALSHFAHLDLALAVFISSSLFSFLIALNIEHTFERDLMLWLAYVFAGLAVLTKGLIGIVFPVMIVGVWILFLKRWKLLLQMRLLSGIIILSSIVFPWYYLEQKTNPLFFHYFFVHEQFDRYLTNHFNDLQPIWYYIPVLVVGLFPWILFWIQTLIKTIQAIKRKETGYENRLFLLLWAFLIFIFFSIPSSKAIGYITPTLPPMAILLGIYFSEQWAHFILKYFSLKKIFSVFASVMFILGFTLGIVMPRLDLPSTKPLASLLLPRLNPNDQVMVYHYYYQDLPLYLGHPVTVVGRWYDPLIAKEDDWEGQFWYGMQFSGNKPWFIDENQFRQIWFSKKRVYLFMDEGYYYQIDKSKLFPMHWVGKYRSAVVVSNH